MLARIYAFFSNQKSVESFPLLDLPEGPLTNNFASQLSIKDLNHLARSCKRLNSLFQPKINLARSLKTAITLHSKHPMSDYEKSILASRLADQEYWIKYPQATGTLTMRK